MKQYEELLHELEKLHGAYVATHNENSNTAKLLWKCHEAIEELTTTKWTKVVDSRPINGKNVISYIQSKDDSRVSVSNYNKGDWVDFISGDNVSNYVTHWRPMPAPPTDPEIYR